MKFLSGMILGVIFTAIGYESEQFEAAIKTVAPIAGDESIGYSFYENLYNTSVTVVEGVYSEVGHAQPEQSKNFSVQLGSFSKEESAEAFRAEVILEGYMPSDITAQPVSGYFRLVIGPFAHKEEAELAMGWAEKRNLSSLLIAAS